jgi:hypothetical protein
MLAKKGLQWKRVPRPGNDQPSWNWSKRRPIIANRLLSAFFFLLARVEKKSRFVANIRIGEKKTD